MIYVICDEISIFYGQKTLGSSIFLSHSLRVSFCLYRRKNNKKKKLDAQVVFAIENGVCLCMTHNRKGKKRA